MNIFKIITKDNDFIVITDTKEKALIKFSTVYPSLKVREITETNKDIFVIS